MSGDGIQNSVDEPTPAIPLDQNPPNFLLTLFIHKASGKVIFAEAKNDFIEFLITLLRLPIGRYSSVLSVQNLANRLSAMNLSQSQVQVRYGRPGENFLINDDLLFKPKNFDSLVEFSGHRDLFDVDRIKVNFGLDEAVKLAKHVGKPDVLSAVFHHLFEA